MTTADTATLLAALREVRRKEERARAELEHGLRECAAAGISERALAEASGLARATVRRIIGRERP